MQQQPSSTTRPQQQSRMTLSAVHKGKIQQPKRIVLYGVEGVGKSSFAANAPNPIFLGPEDGTSHLDVARFPAPESWSDCLAAVQTLIQEKHDYQHFVFDTLDWAEAMLWRYICERDNKSDIEDYGYGKGYVAALDEWRRFLALLEQLRRANGMQPVLLAHCLVKPFKNPVGEDFDRYQMKIHEKAGGLIKEWADCVLFANYEQFASKDAKTKRVRGVSTGARLIYTTRTAAYDAKNRDNLPDSLPLSWGDFWAAVEGQKPADIDEMKAEIDRKAKELAPEQQKTALEYLAKAGNDAVKLAQTNNWVNSKLNEKET